jgi:hypothetical protein
MARFSKIDRRIWIDEKFRRLSKLHACGQGLFLYLLTNPYVGPIPGVYSAGEAMLSEALGWEMKGFREAFREVFREGLVKADFEARFVWIPKAIKYNQPESPNVIKGWQCAWDELPECALKRQAWLVLRDELKDKGSEWVSVFDSIAPEPSEKGMPKPFKKASGKAMANQEQEQEQEQEPETEPEKNSTRDALPPWVPLESWNGYKEMRKRNRKAMTPRAERMVLGKLEELRQQGNSPAAVLDQSTMNGWQGLFPLKDKVSRPSGKHLLTENTQSDDDADLLLSQPAPSWMNGGAQ